MSINHNINCLQYLKQRLKRAMSWNKNRSKMQHNPQSKSNNLNYMIDPTLMNINRLFVFSFKIRGDYPTRNSCDKYYMPLA